MRKLKLGKDAPPPCPKDLTGSTGASLLTFVAASWLIALTGCESAEFEVDRADLAFRSGSSSGTGETGDTDAPAFENETSGPPSAAATNEPPPDDESVEATNDAPTFDHLPRISWTEIDLQGVIDDRRFRVSIYNPSEETSTISLGASYDLGGRERFQADLGTHSLAPLGTTEIDLGTVVTEANLDSMKYAGNLQLSGKLSQASDTSDSTGTIVAPSLYFHPEGDGLVILSETALYARPDAGDYRGEHGGAERKAKLEAALGRQANIRIVDGA